MTSSNKTKIFIDGQHGTTGLQILDRLKDRPDIELLELPLADRKDLGKRAEIAKAADIAVLCLPDAAAKELVAALGDADTVVIDASTAHRVADGWTYGFPEMAKDHRKKLFASNRISNPGCYPTGAIAILRPLVDAGIVPPIRCPPCSASRATPAAASSLSPSTSSPASSRSASMGWSSRTSMCRR